MKKLLSAECKRRLLSPIILAEFLLLLVWDFVLIVFSIYGFEVSSDYFLFRNIPLICILVTANAMIFTREEVEYKTMSNKFYLGFKKSHFLLCEAIVGVLESFLLLTVNTASILGLCEYRHYETTPVRELLFHLWVCFALVSTISVFITILSCIVTKRLILSCLIVGLTALFLYAGDETTHSLVQPKETDAFFEDGKLHPNPLYIDGEKRTLYLLHLTFSPYAQSYYTDFMANESEEDMPVTSIIPNNLSFRLDFIFADSLEILLCFLIGCFLFEKKDLQ